MDSETPLIPALEFQTKMPAVLKIDSSILKAVETLHDIYEDGNSNFSSYIENLRDTTESGNLEGGLQLSTSIFKRLDIDPPGPIATGLFQKAITRLLDYNITKMDNFSLTNQANYSFFSKGEKRRKRIWEQGRNALQDAIEFSTNKLEDHCKLRESVSEFIMGNVGVFHIQYLSMFYLVPFFH